MSKLSCKDERRCPIWHPVSEQPLLETDGRIRGLRHPVEKLKVDACHSASDTFATRFQDQFRRLVMFCCRVKPHKVPYLIFKD
jgi:hypothetical protein